ncbi:MAG: DEAD/DEAH box helicase, partial [Chloroflexi bacterium]|nr:DEAD/DEAH box helicase [Chloroflexota bacterium]
MFAELIINIEAPLEGAFHYHVPRDLQQTLRVGHLVEVEFGRRLAQGIIIAFDDEAPVEETKPIIALIDDEPVVFWWQIELAQWLSQRYLAPLNGCLRLMLPPGLTRWAGMTVEVNSYWDGRGRLTDLQSHIINLLREKGDMRGRQLQRALRKQGEKGNWQTAVNQLHRRKILRKATILDPPRIRPKKIRTVELIAAPQRWQTAVIQLGRQNKQADVLAYLLQIEDPLPEETAVLQAIGAKENHLKKLHERGLIGRDTNAEFGFRTAESDASNPQSILFLAVPPKEALRQLLNLRGAKTYYDILTLLEKEARPVNISHIYAQTKATINHLRKLVKLDLIKFGAEEVWRDPLADRDFVPAQPPLLTPDQARVWGRIKMQMMEVAGGEYASMQVASEQGVPSTPHPPILLHGVTGSGKTEIYMRTIAHALAEGKRAIVLVPEIALTPQTVRRFAARFPGRVAVLHSRLTAGERYDTWRRARAGLFDIVVGPRSALFTPLPNLRVIVLDEEHDPSYKQTPPVP